MPHVVQRVRIVSRCRLHRLRFTNLPVRWWLCGVGLGRWNGGVGRGVARYGSHGGWVGLLVGGGGGRFVVGGWRVGGFRCPSKGWSAGCGGKWMTKGACWCRCWGTGGRFEHHSYSMSCNWSASYLDAGWIVCGFTVLHVCGWVCPSQRLQVGCVAHRVQGYYANLVHHFSSPVYPGDLFGQRHPIPWMGIRSNPARGWHRNGVT